MKNLACICVLLLLAGCSHNNITYSDGIGLETTLNPNTYTFGFNFRYGKIFTATVRENAEIEMLGDGSGTADNASSTSATASGGVKIKIGNQVTGYYVDALGAGATPEQIQEYMKQSEKNSK